MSHRRRKLTPLDLDYVIGKYEHLFFPRNDIAQYFRYNIFFNMQVKNLRIFLKMTHFNQFDRFDGYFVTPYYPAQKKVLDLGVRWYFFN